MAKQDAPVFPDEEIDELIEQFLDFDGPDERSYQRLTAFVERYFSPTVTGVENIPDEPTLFIGNHSMFGLDGMIFLPMLYHETGRFARAMGDNAWFQTFTREGMIKNGTVLAHPRVCSALMEEGLDLLVFPGGAAEANKTAEEKYNLVWRQRYGFVRMAAQHGYNITPFGLVGPDDWFDHRIEGRDLLDTRLGKLLTRMGVTEGLREDLLPPLPAGVFSTLLPKPQRCFLAFGEPVSVPDCRGKKTVPMSVQKSVREETAAKVEQLVADMLLMRTQRKHEEGWVRRLLTR
jgi:1-acyl-sn-glycerol-3-phosphate acyltransferase